MLKTCKCGRRFKVKKPSRLERTKYCSVECKYKFRIRPKGLIYNLKVINRGWFKNLGGSIDRKGYRRIYLGRDKYRREHVVIAEKFLGRPLAEDEVVHHKNGIKTDI